MKWVTPTHVTRDRATLESTDREQEGTTNLSLRIILHGRSPRMARRVASSWNGEM